MKLSATLSSYIGRQFLLWLGVVLGGLAALVLLFDSVELLRRAASREQASPGVVLEMALLRLPYLAGELVPFAVLFGAMLAFWRLTRSHELVVARAAGISVWQFLFPALLITVGVGVLAVAVVGPAASVMLARYERLENSYLRSGTSSFSVSSSGLWLRQIEAEGHTLIHAQRVAPGERVLEDVLMLRFDSDDRFVGRIDAAAARLGQGEWLLRDALVSRPQAKIERQPRMTLPTSLTWRKIEESFASPETMSFWELPTFIQVLEAAGFSALRHRLHYQGMLALPVLLCAMVLIAAAFSLRPGRRTQPAALLAGGVGSGFLLYVASDLVLALGASGRLPVELAAWAPAAVCLMLGAASLLHLEDG